MMNDVSRENTLIWGYWFGRAMQHPRPSIVIYEEGASNTPPHRFLHSFTRFCRIYLPVDAIRYSPHPRTHRFRIQIS
jgi:hypothetical protein